MNARKILEFSPNGPSLFFRFLEHLAKEQGWDFQFEQQTEFHTQLLDEASMANVDMNLSGTILPQLHVLPTLVRTVQCLDAFVQEDGHWYPRLIFFDALRAVLVDRARDLDIRLPAFVVGHLDQARAVCAVLAELGFGEIYVVGQEAEQLEIQIELLRKSHFGIKFKPLMFHELTIQSLSASIIINTVDLSQDKELLSDLSYFNFMKRDGYALDLNLLPYPNPLLEEAERAELRVLHPSLVAATWTHLWIEKLQIETSLKVEELHESWKNFLRENSPSV